MVLLHQGVVTAKQISGDDQSCPEATWSKIRDINKNYILQWFEIFYIGQAEAVAGDVAIFMIESVGQCCAAFANLLLASAGASWMTGQCPVPFLLADN